MLLTRSYCPSCCHATIAAAAACHAVRPRWPPLPHPPPSHDCSCPPRLPRRCATLRARCCACGTSTARAAAPETLRCPTSRASSDGPAMAAEACSNSPLAVVRLPHTAGPGPHFSRTDSTSPSEGPANCCARLALLLVTLLQPAAAGPLHSGQASTSVVGTHASTLHLHCDKLCVFLPCPTPCTIVAQCVLLSCRTALPTPQ